MEEDIIEVEAVEVKVDEKKEESAPKKTKHDHSKAIRRLGKTSYALRRFCFLFFFLSAIFGLVFAILRSQNEGQVYLILMIVGFSLAGLCFLGYVTSFILIAFMRRLKKDDPNFADSENMDAIY